MSSVWMAVIGFVVGLIARAMLPGTQNVGIVMTSLLGIGGSLVGGVISSVIFKSPEGKFHPAGFFMSIVGALILLWAYLKFMV